MLMRESAGVHTHSQTILPMVQGVLTEAGVALTQCDAIAFGCGPGSFTGVRTACGIAQGLAFGASLPVIPVVTLLAMAEACREAGDSRDVLAVLDARMGEVYWAQYRFQDEQTGWQAVAEPTLSAASAVQADGRVIACGNGLSAYADDFARFDFADSALPMIMPRAAQVAWLAQAAFARGEILSARDAQPLYLRNKVALTTAERMANAAGVAA